MYDGKVRDSGFKYQELQDKSGPETHILPRRRPVVTRSRPKGPRRCHNRICRRATPGAPRCSASRWNPQDWSCPRDTGEQFQQGRHRDAAFRRHGLKGAGRRRRGVRGGILAGDGLVQLDRARAVATHGVVFQRVRRAGRGQRAVLQDGLPGAAFRALMSTSWAAASLSLMMLISPGVQAHTARPFPHVAHKVRDTGGAVVMPPAHRPGAGQRASVQMRRSPRQARTRLGQACPFRAWLRGAGPSKCCRAAESPS